MASRIRAAVVQLQCNDTGDKQHNIDLIEKLVADCCGSIVADGSEGGLPTIILLPELATAGYTFDRETLWKLGEPSRETAHQNAVTENLLCKLAFQYKVYIGCSYLEASKDGNFYNTFALAGPDGNVKGRVRKSRPAGAEAYLFAGSDGAHVIEADGLRFGVLICFENYLSSVISELQQVDTPLDVVLSPFSGPLYEPRKDLYNDRPGFIAQALYAPCLYVNKWGPWTRSEFPGQCAIADADGNVLVRMGDTGNGSEVREVQLGRSLRAERGTTDAVTERPVVCADKGRFVGGSWVMQLTRPLEFFGGWSYRRAAAKRQELVTRLAK